MSSEGKDFIKKLVCPVSKRMTAEQALAHPWITNRTKLAEFAIDDEVSLLACTCMACAGMCFSICLRQWPSVLTVNTRPWLLFGWL